MERKPLPKRVSGLRALSSPGEDLNIMFGGPGQELPQEMAQRLGLEFHDILLLNLAFTHRSYLNEHPEAIEDNERLEFLGDAILGFLVGAWLYHEYPEMPEGHLTRMRSALVQTEQLADFSQGLGFGQVLKLGRGEAQSGGGMRDALLCDVFEAFIAALFIDQGIEQVRNFLDPLLQESTKDILKNNKFDDPKSLFQEWAQAKFCSTPRYVIKNSSGPDHSRLFEVDVIVVDEVYGSGSGSSKQAATKTAAQDAINRHCVCTQRHQNSDKNIKGG
jgi:ribonuclease-3